MTTDITELERQVEHAKRILSQLQKELSLARQTKWGIAVGDVVTSKRYGKVRITNIDTNWRDRPWLKGNAKKKDGEWGAVERHLYDQWEKP